MGHIDHGKSTLLDYIRKENTTTNEAGGITQHVAAYEVTQKDENGIEKSITFIDTPGHAAFSAIRKRGAALADIAILVIAADDGVKPQTIEAYKAIKEQGTPFIVALNKADLPASDPEKVKRELMEHEIFVEGLGGDVPVVSISAKTGAGVEELLSMILLVAEMSDITGDPTKTAQGIVIESNVDKQRGISATLLITDGTLSQCEYVVSGTSGAPVRIMNNYAGKSLKKAVCGQPVTIIGWSAVPLVGNTFITLPTKKEAEAYIKDVTEAQKNTEVPRQKYGADVCVIPVVLKADVTGSLEAIEKELIALQADTVKLNFIVKSIGPITEADIKSIVGNSGALIIGFNVKADTISKHLADRESLSIHTFNIIYRVSEFIAEEIKRRTPKVRTEEIVGKARILKCFSQTKDKQVLGARLQEGFLSQGNSVRIIRRENVIGNGTIVELQQQKAKVKEVKEESSEFGMLIESKREIAENDYIEAIRIVEQ